MNLEFLFCVCATNQSNRTSNIEELISPFRPSHGFSSTVTQLSSARPCSRYRPDQLRTHPISLTPQPIELMNHPPHQRTSSTLTLKCGLHISHIPSSEPKYPPMTATNRDPIARDTNLNPSRVFRILTRFRIRALLVASGRGLVMPSGPSIVDICGRPLGHGLALVTAASHMGPEFQVMYY
ncbi:hypothetical protein BO82DRAFT_183938 [Aspergillus uvarum CBS 121591]|uniref:Uncharacterized protein n=1 Tax=Aspergillus uvarum CBS 121591 TaxID=1448315 RepID=A0A319CHV9_9EURO|nr:hypothetical protein BO82DRAFT_183938 [Aspergillus uvarum CBS 121591]PYH85366.1 hypothetical protein BO82DRAFT_183938 [Aspergillus uvarum CBS 121591]